MENILVFVYRTAVIAIMNRSTAFCDSRGEDLREAVTSRNLGSFLDS